MRKFLTHTLMLFTFPFLVMFLNIVIDYRGMFGISNTFVSNLTKFHMSKRNIELFVNLPGREIVKSKIKLLRNKNLNKVVIGSSRTLQLGIPLLMDLHNFSVSSANIMDYKLILKLINEANIKVDSIIFDTNQSLFDLMDDNKRHEILNESNYSEKIRSLWSLTYLKMNLQVKKAKLLIGDSSANFISYYDGSISYKDKYEENRFNTKEKLNYISKQSLELKKYQFDKKKFDDFISILNTQSEKVNHITLYITPVPSVIFKEHHQLFSKINTELKNKLKQFNNVSVVGDFNPDLYSISNEEFMDAYHIHKSGLLKIW